MDILWCILALAGFIVLGVLNNRVLAPRVIKPEPGKAYTRFEKCDPPLGTFNGIGSSLYDSGGRLDFNTGSTAQYLFFCFFIPLFPCGCYRARIVGSSGKSTQYQIFGHERWSFWEFFTIYIRSIAWVGGVISVIALLVTIFN